MWNLRTAAGVAGVVVVAGLAFTSPAVSQEPPVKVLVAHSGDDSAGKQLAFFLKDKIRGSSTFADNSAEAAGGMGVQLITMDPNGARNQTIYSATIVLRTAHGLDYYMTSFVGVCGTSRLSECAQSLYADLGQQLEDIRKMIRDAESTD